MGGSGGENGVILERPEAIRNKRCGCMRHCHPFEILYKVPPFFPFGWGSLGIVRTSSTPLQRGCFLKIGDTSLNITQRPTCIFLDPRV